MNDEEYALLKDRVYYSAGVDKGSKAEGELDKAFGTYSTAKTILSSAGFDLDNKKRLDETTKAMSIIAQAKVRQYPREQRIGFDFGDDKTNFLVKAYEDVFSGRADSVKGSYKYTWGKPEKGLPGFLQEFYDPGALMDKADRIFTAPWAAGVAAIAEMHQNAGGSEESAKHLYGTLMNNIDWISLIGGFVTGGMSIAAKSQSMANQGRKAADALSTWATKFGVKELPRTDIEEHISQTALKAAIDIKRGLQVVNPATTVRNFANVAIGRSTLEGVTDVTSKVLADTANTVRKVFYGTILGKEVKPVATLEGRQIAEAARSTFRFLGDKKYRNFIDEVIATHPRDLDTMMTRYVGDMERRRNPGIVRKMTDLMNTPNWMQEIFNRKVKFLGSLDDQLVSQGFKNGVDDIIDTAGKITLPGALKRGMVNKAADDALYYTFAKEPEGIAKNLINWMENTKTGNALLATGINYPRFMWNAWQHFNELNPLHALKTYKLLLNKPVSRMELKEMAGGITGAMLMASYGELENMGVIGEDWANINIGGKDFDMKAMLGPYALFAYGGHLINRAIQGKAIPADALKEAMTTLLPSPSLYDFGIPQAAEALDAVMRSNGTEFNDNFKEVVTGQYTFGSPEMDKAAKAISTFVSGVLSGYLTPMRFGGDILASTDSEEAIARDMYTSPNPINISPLIGQIPYLKHIIPPKYEQTRAGPKVFDDQWVKQVTGLNPMSYNFVQRELKNLGFSKQEISGPKSGVALYDYYMAARTGQYMESISNWLDKNPIVMVKLGNDNIDIPPIVKRYDKLENRYKAEFWRNLTITARDFADMDVRNRLLTEGREDVLQQYSKSKIAQKKIDAMKAAGYDFNEMDVSPAKLTSPSWVRDQLTLYRVEPTDTYVPKGKE